MSKQPYVFVESPNKYNDEKWQVIIIIGNYYWRNGNNIEIKEKAIEEAERIAKTLNIEYMGVENE